MAKFVMADCSGGMVDGDLLDACREAQTKEARCWRVVGPLKIGGKEAFKAQRDADGTVPSYKPGEVPSTYELADVEYLEFTDKSSAVDFIMWRALQAGIEHYIVSQKPASALLVH